MKARKARRHSETYRDVTEPTKIRFRRMRILYIKIRHIRIRVRICWCTIKVQPNTLVNFKRNFCIYFYFLSFTLQQISTKDYDILKFSLTFCFNDQSQSVSGQQLIFLKFKTKIKSEFVRTRVCKSVGFGFANK